MAARLVHETACLSLSVTCSDVLGHTLPLLPLVKVLRGLLWEPLSQGAGPCLGEENRHLPSLPSVPVASGLKTHACSLWTLQSCLGKEWLCPVPPL